MTRVRVDKRFVLLVNLDASGDVVFCTAQDNDTLSIFEFDISTAPEFVAERIALMKLTDVNKSEKGELIGRRYTPELLVVYLTYDEYQQLKEECK